MCVSIAPRFYSPSSSFYWCVLPPTAVVTKRNDLPISRTLGDFPHCPGPTPFLYSSLTLVLIVYFFPFTVISTSAPHAGPFLCPVIPPLHSSPLCAAMLCSTYIRSTQTMAHCTITMQYGWAQHNQHKKRGQAMLCLRNIWIIYDLRACQVVDSSNGVKGGKREHCSLCKDSRPCSWDD